MESLFFFYMYFFLFLFFLLILITFAYAAKQAAPWVPIRRKDVERVIKLANIKPNEVFYEPGCGDGRIVCAAAEAGAKAIGYEISLLPFLIAKCRQVFLKNRKHCSIRYRNFWHTSFKDADIVFLFLLPESNVRMEQKLRKELKPGARIVAYVWPLKGWVPVAVDERVGCQKIYLYTKD